MRERRQELVLHVAHPLGRGAGGALAVEERLSFVGGPLGGLEEAGIVDGHSGLDRHRKDQPFRAFREHSGTRVAKKQPADHFAGPRPDRHCQIAAHRQVAGRHAVMRPHRAVARVLQHVVTADGIFTAKRRAEQGRRPRLAELFECLSGRAGERVEQERVAVLVGRVVEKGAKLGAAHLGRSVGYGLHDQLEVQLGCQRLAGLVEQLQDARLLAQRRLRLFPPRDVFDDADESLRLPGCVRQQRHRRQAPDDRAVLAQVTLLERVIGDRAGEQLTHRSARIGEIVGMRDGEKRQLLQLLDAVAKDIRELAVHVEEMAVEGRDGDADRGLIEDRPQPLLALTQGLLRPQQILLRPLAGSHDAAGVLQRHCAQPLILVVEPGHYRPPSTRAASAVPATRARIFANAVSRLVEVSSENGEKPQSSVVPS